MTHPETQKAYDALERARQHAKKREQETLGRIVTLAEVHACPTKRLDPQHYLPYTWGCACVQEPKGGEANA